MKKLIAVLLATALLLCAFVCADEDLLAKVQEKGKLIVASEGCWVPWTYIDDDGEHAGFDLDLAREIAKKLGVEVEFVDCPWDSLFGGLESGRYDIVINGVEWTEEREEKYAFSTPYAYMRTVLIVRGDNESITCFEDLAGKKTANTLSSTYAQLGESYGATTVGVDDLDSTMRLVIQGRVDATLNAQVSYAEYISLHPEANVKVVAQTEDASIVGVIMRKDCTTLIDAVNAAIAELREEGVLSELSIKYFGVDVT